MDISFQGYRVNALINSPFVLLAAFLTLLLGGCTTSGSIKNAPPAATAVYQGYGQYQIEPGDMLNLVVWRHPEVSIQAPVRPDGRISTPLAEDVVAVGKNPTQLARDIEKVLSAYIKQPRVTVIVQDFGDGYSQQIRIIGQAQEPKALQYQQGMTLLDVLIAVGGLTEYAAGNRASVIRAVTGVQEKIDVKLLDLIDEGDLSVNMDMMPGDILVIPQSWF